MGEVWEFQKGKMGYLAMCGLCSHILTIAYILLILLWLIGSIWH